jgi:hypothetical protein
MLLGNRLFKHAAKARRRNIHAWPRQACKCESGSRVERFTVASTTLD